jgi:hypothetical protein
MNIMPLEATQTLYLLIFINNTNMEAVRITEVGVTLVPFDVGPEILFGNRPLKDMSLLFR